VAGTADPTAGLTLSKLPLLNPDLVTLDIGNCRDGRVWKTLPERRKAYQNCRVIMFSTLTERGSGLHDRRLGARFPPTT